MESLHRSCAGLDVHKQKVVACVRRLIDGKVRQEVRTFRTETNALLDLADWLTDHQVSHVAMESTGVYWKPIWNLFEGVFTLLLVNAEHIKKVPGRKTDVSDSQWIAELLQFGLLKPSFVPPKPIRQLRDLTRQRVQLTRQKVQVANRLQKTLEDANVKLGSVASDVLGASGRDMIRAIIRGETDPVVLANLARQRLRKKIPQLQEALCGEIEDHHRFLLRLLLEQVDFLERQIAALGVRIGEVGADLTPFASVGQLASWVGLCPGNHESAGKRRSGRTTQGNRWLRVILIQCAWAASRTKGTQLRALFERLRGRRGAKRALVAVAHRLLEIVYILLKRQETYREKETPSEEAAALKARQAQRLLARLEKLGVRVRVESEAVVGSEPVAVA